MKKQKGVYMKKQNSYLSRISMLLFFIVPAFFVFSTYTFAKYVYDFDGSGVAHPAKYEFIVVAEDEPSIFVNFGLDGETSPIYGTRSIIRDYNFSVQSAGSEVASLMTIEVFLPQKLYDKISAADKTVAGVWVNFRMCVVDNIGLETESLEDITPNGTFYSETTGDFVVEEDGVLWVYQEHIPPNCNPSNREGLTNFRLEFEVLNVDDTSWIRDAFIYVSNIKLDISSKQIN